MNNLSTEAKRHIDSIIDGKNLSYIYYVLENGVIALNEYKKANPTIFNSCYASNISGRMLSHFINMQFEESFLSNKIPFNVRCRQEHSTKIPEIIIGNIVLTPKRGNSIKEILDGETKYMKSLSRGNRVLDGQFSMFDFLLEDIPKKMYGVIVYSDFNDINKQFDLVKIIFPDESLRGCYYLKDIRPKVRILSSKSEIIHDEGRIIDIDRLTKDMQKTLVNNKETVTGDDK